MGMQEKKPFHPSQSKMILDHSGHHIRLQVRIIDFDIIVKRDLTG